MTFSYTVNYMTAFICRKMYFVLIVQCRELKIVEQLSLSSFFPSHFSILFGFFRSWRCSCPCQNHSAQISRIHSDLKSAPISTAKAKRIVHIWPQHYCGFYTAINLHTHHWCRFCSRFIADFSVDFKCEHTLRLGSHGCLNFGGISTQISAVKICSAWKNSTETASNSALKTTVWTQPEGILHLSGLSTKSAPHTHKSNGCGPRWFSAGPAHWLIWMRVCRLFANI